MKLLAVSLAFPPLAYPRSIQVARLLKHLEAETVLFCADELGARVDSTIEPDAEARLKECIRIPVPKNGGIMDRFLYRFARGAWNRRNLVPDSYGRWKRLVLAAAERRLRSGDFAPDVMVTFAQPFVDHLIGLELRSRFDIPWSAHFSDPWADNPFTPFDRPTHAANLVLEKQVAETADSLIFTSAETVDLFCRKYGPEIHKKARVLPQCYDSPEFSSEKRPRRITLRYLGNFYGKRSPAPLIAALVKLFRTSPERLANLAVELIGAGDAGEVKRLASDLPDGLIVVRESVGYAESLRLMATADGLLVIDAPAELSVFLPSKLIDYIGAGKPVFGITPQGTAAALIRELGGRIANPSDAEGVEQELAGFIRDLEDRRIKRLGDTWGNPEVRDRFTAERISRDFLSILNELKA